MPRCFHFATDSSVTEDSGLGGLTPRDSSADELEDHQQRQDVGGGPGTPPSTSSRPAMLLSSVGGHSAASTTSVNSDSGVDARVDNNGRSESDDREFSHSRSSGVASL